MVHLSDSLINSLQNYYGHAIRSNRGNLELMVKAVQATLLHSNSSDEAPRHHLCPTGKESWCKWQRAQALGIKYSHTKPPIPEAILHLLKPIYAMLGSPLLLQKCLQGYTQNANEALHSTVWKLSPKELFLGKKVLILHVQLLFQSSTMDLVLNFHCLNGVNLLRHASADICFEREIHCAFQSQSIRQVTTEKPSGGG